MSNGNPTNQAGDHTQTRVAFFGMRCAFSVPPLLALIDAGLDVRAVLLPGPAGATPVATIQSDGRRVVHLRSPGSPPSLDEVAAAASVPVISVRGLRRPEVIAAIEALAPDIIAVACFPWLIPEEIRAIPRIGCLNLHPSLLPRWRGPEPVFWAFRAGDSETGATVHFMDDGFDTGPVVAQHHFPIPPGIAGSELEQELAVVGGALLVDAILNVVRGTFTASPQDESKTSFARIPNDDDLVFSTSESAAQLFNVIRGVVPLWGAVNVRIPASEAEFTVDAVLDVDVAGVQERPFIRNRNMLLLQCNPGVITLLESGSERLHALTGFDPV